MARILAGSEPLSFRLSGRKDKYEWLSGLLVKTKYRILGKKDKGIVFRYAALIAGYSAIQLKRLIKTFKKKGLQFVARTRNAKSFATIYGPVDVALLIKTDEAHGCLNGWATKEILRREYEVFGHTEYENISRISISHLYNLRNENVQYQSSDALLFKKTQAVQIGIGIRRKPRPDGKPGYIRVDSVHQGDFEGRKGVYHINIVDEVTQWEIIATVERITEECLELVLQAMLELFPFVLIEFHSDNGSEYINFMVANMLNRLTIKQSKSRSGRCNDNALVETKNGSVIRKQFGKSHIPQVHAEAMNNFDLNYLNIYVNFHRPCRFSVDEVNPKTGKIKKRYVETMTPYDKFKSLPNAESYLKDGITFADLDRLALADSDNEFAEKMRQAKMKMFAGFRESKI